jgi:hypothetical protein
MPIVSDKYRGTVKYYQALAELIFCARNRRTTNYSHIAHVVGIPEKGNYMGREVGHLVGEISEDEVIHGRPMLSVLVVNKREPNLPSTTFFDLARRLGVLENMANDAFWQHERDRLFQIWSVPPDLL